MRHSRWPGYMTGCLVVVLSLLVPVPHSKGQEKKQQPNEVVFQPTGLKSRLSLIEGEVRRVQLPDRIAQVEGFDEEILKASILPGVANQIRVVAMTPGTTTLTLTDEFGRHFSIEVVVAGDTRQLEAIIRQAFPEASVTAVKVKDSVLLTGWVNQQDQLTPIVSIAEQFFPKVLNYMKVGGVQQVMLRVRIMEVQRSTIRHFGFNFLNINQQGYVHSLPGSLATLAGTASSSPVSLPFGAAPSAGISTPGFNNSTFTFGITGSNSIFNGFLEALKEERLLKILAEPNLVTVNGRQANFINGGEFPIPVPQSLGTVTIQWREFGVKLSFVPYVLGAGRLRLDVQPEVSDQDPSTAVTLNGTTVPGLSTRKVETQVEMNFGQTLVIAGLINNRIRTNTQKVPFFGELPWIGAAFRRVKEDTAETELLVMVTPELVAPMDPEQVPAEFPGSTTTQPTDKELFINGQIEVPKLGPECPDGLCPPNYPINIPLTAQPDPTPAAPYDSSPGLRQPGIETPAPPAPDDSVPAPPQARRSQRNSTGRTSYFANRATQLPGSRVQQAGASDDSRSDRSVQQSGYDASQETTPRTAPQRRNSRPGMIAPQ
ncbi:MAG: type and secretion system protein [Planctomycetaceae bacterium]|nr:type and secretion system protein [Planctomycetaceae bacterium]